MGLFSKKVHVNVMGNSTFDAGGDGRYSKQARRNKKMVDQKEKMMELKPHTPAELRGYIEEKYGIEELPRSDERYKLAFMNVKSHLVLEYQPELLKTVKLEVPNHPPVSDTDPDYEAYYKNERDRFKEAVMVDPSVFPVRLHVYSIPIIINDLPIAWVEVSVETEHRYLALRTIKLEYEQHYSIDKVKKDIITYFGASEEDRKEQNERYLQLLSVQ